MFPNNEKLEKLFRAVSYGTAFCGLLCLFAAGSIGTGLFTVFLLITLVAWFIEDTRWQLSERVGVALIFLIIPLFYIDWKFRLTGFTSRDAFAAGSLSIMILALASVKLLQRKIDRDWVFLYLISFFEILLAAGVSISPLFLSVMILYLLLAFSAIILFEIRKTSRSVLEIGSNGKVRRSKSGLTKSQLFRLPATSFSLLLLIAVFAVPLFFAFPRVGGAGFGGGHGGLSGFTGFSDSVRLGEIGRLQQSNEVVMRVRVEKEPFVQLPDMRWRGVALDYFDNQTWRKSRAQYAEPFMKNDRNLFLIDGAKDTSQLVTQTVYLEPIDTPVLFALSRPVAVEANFQLLNKDIEGSLNTPRSGWERISYKIYSDTILPAPKQLREDNAAYAFASRKYLRLPDGLDPRISGLAQDIISQSHAMTRFDQAKAVEKYLQTSFNYTLDLKAGGKEPLADFLFNVREGHCEYFASAMAIMLRTQGIATRIVNGFQTGEYNQTADVYVVRQKEAHSWVEVYFPTEKVWVPFDPTPAVDQTDSVASTGFAGQFRKYLETLETFWIQYVVSYDNQEQRSLFKSLRNNLIEIQNTALVWLKGFEAGIVEWWKEVRGEKGFGESVKAIAIGVGVLAGIITGAFLLFWLFRKLRTAGILAKIRAFFRRDPDASIVEFYERMQKILARRGYQRDTSQTPLEFAFALNMPEAVKVTERYNCVRFGEKKLSKNEAKEIESWLSDLEKYEKVAKS